MKYYSTKKFGPITTGHRQWKDSGHCKYVHGYARYVEITFACHDLNDKQWVMDFGGLKHIKKHKKKMYKLRQAKKESSPFYGLGKKKTGYGSFIDKTKWL